MNGVIVQFVVGGVGLVVVVWLKGMDFVRVFSPPLPPSVARWLKRVVGALALFVVVACFIDPFIPGTADLTIHAPRGSTMGLNTLVVEAVPVGFRGERGADQTRYASFDTRGISQITVPLGFLDTRVRLRVFEEPTPSRSLVSESRYVNPFVRRRLCVYTVRF